MLPLKRKSFFSQIIDSKLFIISGLALLIFLGYSVSKEVARRYEISQQIKSLRQEIASLDQSNQEITNLISYLKSETYQEKQARLKLGLSKEGESVVIIPSVLGEKESQINKAEQTNASDQTQPSAPKSWWDYFFNK